MLPACCLPLWGKEGVTLIAAAKNYRMTGKKGFQQSQKNLKKKQTALFFYTICFFLLAACLMIAASSGNSSSGLPRRCTYSSM
jgi:hypothetical protein